MNNSLQEPEWMIHWMKMNQWFIELTWMNDVINEQSKMIYCMYRNEGFDELTGMNDSLNERYIEWTGVN